MKPLSGPNRDMKAFGQVVSDPMAQGQPTFGTTDLIADSGLSSDANLQQLAKTQLTWITRAPATLSDA
jgi:transposase